MAIFNETLEGRFNKVIQALHGIKGHTPAPQITPEIGHQIILENDRPEYNFLAGVTRYSSGLVSQAADATHFSEVEFLNPVNSGSLVVVEQLVLFDLGAFVDYDVRTFPALLATLPASGSPLDLRESATKRSVLQNRISNQVVAKSGSQIELTQNPVNTTVGQILSTAAPGLILPPGGVFAVFGNVINQQVSLLLLWRERAISRDELVSR